jgi:DNA invertase Pin-like site-specific DNA recombinase
MPLRGEPPPASLTSSKGTQLRHHDPARRLRYLTRPSRRYGRSTSSQRWPLAACRTGDIWRVRGHEKVAHFFDVGQSRTVAWGRRPEAAALVARLADPGRGWDAIVIGEYERAFYGSQYAAMAPLFEHYGVQLWMPEAGGRVDYACEHDEQAMTVLGLSSKREITRASIRVRTAMAAQTRRGRYLGGRPPYGYRLADAGPHPNKAHAAWGRRAHRLEPGPGTAHVVSWIFAQRLAGHSVARITRALNDAGIRARRRPALSGTRTVRPRRGRWAR